MRLAIIDRWITVDGREIPLAPEVSALVSRRAHEVLKSGPEHGWNIHLMLQVAYLQGLADGAHATDRISEVLK